MKSFVKFSGLALLCDNAYFGKKPASAEFLFQTNSEDPDQMPHTVASDQGLHCLPRATFMAHLILINDVEIISSGLLSEEQCKARDVRRKAKTSRVVRKSESMEGSPMSDKSSEFEDSKANVKLKANIKAETIVEEEPIAKVSNDTKILIEKCVFLQDKYEFPDEQIIQTVSVSISYN